jgi:hypothetical protein
MKSSSTWFVGLFIALASGCTSGPSDEDYDDVATSVGALTASDSGGDVGAMGDAVEASQGQAPEGTTAEGSGSFSGARGGLEYEYALTCSDASGAVLASCDGTTDLAHLTVDWSGELHLARFDASLARSGDWTLSAIQSETPVLNGVGSFDASTSFQALWRDETRTMDLEYDANYDGVELSKALRRPVGGTATFNVHVERTRETSRRDVEAEFDIEAVVTFTDAGTANLVLDGSRSYVVNLTDGSVAQD